MDHRELAATPLPVQPFFTTPEQRLALARERFFEQGIRPSGLVGEAVIQSWSRCLQARRNPDEAVAFNQVTESRVHSALTRSRQLRESAAAELQDLERALAGTPCTVLLTDPLGVVVHVGRGGGTVHDVIMPVVGRIGVNLGEDSVGTNAPGLTSRTGQASVVLGGEHYFACVQTVHCAAAPIRDVRGQIAGVLDVSCESRPFGFDAAAVIGMFATAIENRLLRAQSNEHVVVHLQASPGLLDTPMEGLAGIGGSGHIAWANKTALKLLGIDSLHAELDAETTFALSWSALVALTRETVPHQHTLPSGLAVWLRARMQAPDGAGKVVRIGAVGIGSSRAARPPA